MPPFLVIAAEAHRSHDLKCNFYPWTDEDRRYVGWRLRFDDEHEEFVYLVPLTEGEDAMALYHGLHGDPSQDERIGTFDK